MAWTYAYDTTTGELLGETDVPYTPPAGVSVLVTTEREGQTTYWDVATRTFLPRPVKNIVEKSEFILRFTDNELDALLTIAKTNVKAEVFVKVFMSCAAIDLTDPRIITAINRMETAGVIGAGRATEILNG